MDAEGSSSTRPYHEPKPAMSGHILSAYDIQKLKLYAQSHIKARLKRYLINQLDF